MSFIDKVIHTLDEYKDSAYVEDKLQSIKEHIMVLINSKDNIGLLSFSDLDLNVKNFSILMSEKIYHIISSYEHRIQILSIEYDDTLAPWQLIFFVRFCYSSDNFKEFTIKIIFRNNRYCEVA